MNNPNYTYDRCRGVWYIYKMEYIGKSSYGTKVSEPYFDKEEAKKETYRLNGWNYTEPNN